MDGLPRFPILYTRAQVTDLIVKRDTDLRELRAKLRDAENRLNSVGILSAKGIDAINDGVHADKLREIFRDIASGGRRG